MEKLIRWKEDIDRKPLILNGARQVGKTWILKEFGNKYYTKTAYINMDNTSTYPPSIGYMSTYSYTFAIPPVIQWNLSSSQCLCYVVFSYGAHKSVINRCRR